MKAVAREFVGCDVVPDVAGLNGVGQQAPDQVAEVLPRSDDVLPSVQPDCELRSLVPVRLLREKGVRLEDGLEALASGASLGGSGVETWPFLALTPGSGWLARCSPLG